MQYPETSALGANIDTISSPTGTTELRRPISRVALQQWWANGDRRAPGTMFSYRSSDQRFTGKERDLESGLDWFSEALNPSNDQSSKDGQPAASIFATGRYYGPALGRFTSWDIPLWDQYAMDPQSWNLYPYIWNNPLTNIDHNEFYDFLRTGGGGVIGIRYLLSGDAGDLLKKAMKSLTQRHLAISTWR
jgi:RHS repeat-associated protein